MEDRAKSPFVRYRHGNELLVPANIIESIVIFLKEYKERSDVAFRTLIKDIADGSGSGISVESTWFQAISELFESHRDYSEEIQAQVKIHYIDIFKLIVKKGTSEEIWKHIQQYFSINMDILSLWQFSHYRSSLLSTNPFRDADGNVYYEENFEGERVKVQVIDGQTLADARYSYITEAIYSKYGAVGMLLRLCRLVFIEKSLTNIQDDYSIVKFVMSEGDRGHDTWFLQGYWQVNSAKSSRIIKWHPKDYYCDLSWLESDLSLIVANSVDFQSKAVTHPNAPVRIEESDQSLLVRSIKGFRLQYEVALDTILFISGNRDEITDEIFIEFGGRLIRWVNGSLFRYPVLIIPTNDKTMEDAIQIAKQFISMIIFENNYLSIREVTSVGHPVNYYPMIKQPRLSCITTISAEWLNRSQMETSKIAWEALSFYKEAKNSEGFMYQFLNYYKIVHMPFLTETGREDEKRSISWINQELQTMSQDENVMNIINDTKTFNSTHKTTLTEGEYLSHCFRDAASHVGKLHKAVKSGLPTAVPDNPIDQLRYRTAVPVLEELARKTIKNGLRD